MRGSDTRSKVVFVVAHLLIAIGVGCGEEPATSQGVAGAGAGGLGGGAAGMTVGAGAGSAGVVASAGTGGAGASGTSGSGGSGAEASPPPPSLFPTADQDGDGLSNQQEAMLGTDPYYQDTDADTFSDAEEVGADATQPIDTDGDGIADVLEHPLFDFDRDGTTDPEDASDGGWQLVYVKFDPPVIANDGVDETRLLVKLTRADSVSAVSVRWENLFTVSDLSPAGLAIEGQPVGDEPIELRDDGTHGDWIAGDGVFSRGGIRTVQTLESFDGKRDVVAVNRLSVTDASGERVLPLGDTDPLAGWPVPASCPLVLVRADTVPEITMADAQMQKSARVLNLVDREMLLVLKKRQHGYNAEVVAAEGSFIFGLTVPVFEAYGGDADFIFFFSPTQDFPTDSGFETTLVSPETGIGDLVVPPNPAFGSDRLRSVLQFPFWIDPPMNHEITHSWAVRLDHALGFDDTPHWGWAGANGLLGGFDPATLVDHGDGTFTVDWFQPLGNSWRRWVYSPIELYLMGLASADEVEPMPVLHDVEVLADDGVTIDVMATQTTVSIDDIVARHGPRVPAYPDARSDFAAVFVLPTERPATASEMALVEQFALELGADRAPPAITFREATGDRATMNTLLP